jgi:HD-GYP domain-containing protein (c-di-GMP phosphodiesterase class II)
MSRERLLILSGPNQGASFEIEDTLSIGRNPDSGILLEDPLVSRRHAAIERTPSGVFLRDLKSGNGTYIGKRRIIECRLAHGDIIRIGGVELRFESQETDSNVLFQSNLDGRVEAAKAANIYETFFSPPPEEATFEQQRNAQNRLAAIYHANQIISSERDLRKLFGRVMDQIFDMIPAHSGVIMLKDNRSGELVTEYVKSDSPETVISSSIVKRAFDLGEAVITYNAADDARFESGASIISQNISSAMCAPLIHLNETLGVLYVDTRGTTNAFGKGDLEMLVAFSGPAAVAIKNVQYLQQLERAYHDTLIAISDMVSMRDHYTVGHTWRVTNFAIEIARILGWNEEQIEECEMGGLLHDVGKIAVDDAILRKPGQLTPEEYAIMRVHPERGAWMLQDVERLRPLVPYCLYHHERYDGKGYPFGLAGESIPIEGRLIAVADTFDAMTSSRPYRKGMQPDVAIAEIVRARGAQFDPAIVDALVECYHTGKIAKIIQDFHKGGGSIVCPFCSTFISIPEGAVENDCFRCPVCHRAARLVLRNNAFFGDLVSETLS